MDDWYKTIWNEVDDLKNEADLVAYWWLGFNSSGEDTQSIADYRHRTKKYVDEAVLVYRDCPKLDEFKARLTRGINKKLYLEKYIRRREDAV